MTANPSTRSLAWTPASWATRIRISPSTQRRPTRCCKPPCSLRNSSSTKPWSPPSPTGRWKVSPLSTPPAAQGISCSAPSAVCTIAGNATPPALGPRELVEKALDGVYGVDINPFAVAIARFRLLVAALHAAGDTSIEQKIHYEPHLAAGDSLLWGASQQALDDDLLMIGQTVRADTTENAEALTEILQREHDVVVGNPPYITVKDAALNATYRQLYSTPHRQYALTVPFMELFFRLAYPSGQERPAGWVGQITSNSFMKREFGSKLIEKFLPTVDLRMVIDTSGAYIPGHGTPTVIIVGRNQNLQPNLYEQCLASAGNQADRATQQRESYGRTIVNILMTSRLRRYLHQRDDMPRNAFSTHPWTLSGGGAIRLQDRIDDRARTAGWI